VPKYPRKPGSSVRVDVEQWVLDNPFGHCPACGSVGIEEFRTPGDPDARFHCSDETCMDTRGHLTIWGARKPEGIRIIEIEKNWSWNVAHFQGQNIS
jgi:hypothetical protein